MNEPTQSLEPPVPADNLEYEHSAERAFAGKEPDQPMSSMGSDFLAEFHRAEIDRYTTEQRWLTDLRQYKGKYEPDEEVAIGPKRSRSFVRKTRVKVKTVNSRISDLLFPAGNDKNWNIDPTPDPEVSDEERQEVVDALKKQQQQVMDMQAQAQAQAAPQPGQAPADPSGAPPQAMSPQAAPMQQQVVGEPPKNMVDAAILEKCKAAAREMSKVIDDQLVEARYKTRALQVVHSCHLYGTGVLKGPLVEMRVRTRFKKMPVTNAAGQATGQTKWGPYTEQYAVPFVDCVPLWRFYPDMGATELQQLRFIFERHNFTSGQLFDLSKNQSFNKKLIVEYLQANPNGMLTARTYDNELKIIGERDSKQSDVAGQYEVLERWGYVTGAKLKEAGVVVPEDREQESFFANVWLFPNGTVIKAVLQPIDGVTWPYHLYYFDKDETSIFGEGLSAIMRDDQKMINAATRMILDNAAITSGPMLEVVAELLSSGEDPTDIYPWKVWLRKQADIAKGPAVRAIALPNSLEDLERIVAQFDKNADEVTAIPRYVTGENATQGAAGTSSGLSMLMGALNIVIKDLLTGYDEGVTVPFLQALYHWNMKFNKRIDIKGDFDVCASGTASLVAKEVRSRQLNEFAQISSNPLDAKFIKRHKLIQCQAEALEMVDIVKTEEEVKAEDESDEAKKQRDMADQMQQAQLAEQQAKVGKLTSDAELANKKAEESAAHAVLLTKRLEEIAANIDKIVAETVSRNVESVFAALQAGGVATSRPTIAPAGDEILKSSGFVDKNGDPSIAALNGPPVQDQQGTESLMQRGQSFQHEPRGDEAPTGDLADAAMQAQGQEQAAAPQSEPGQPDAVHQADDTHPAVVTDPQPKNMPSPNQMTPEPQTGMVGRRAGMETDRIEAPR